MGWNSPYYQQLLEAKEHGELPAFDQITREQLAELWTGEHLSDSMIASLFGVPKSRVTQKRRSFGPTMVDGAAQHLQRQLTENPELRRSLARELLISPDQRGPLAAGLTRYVFRDGPVEDMHAAGQLSQADMKVLNQFTANRIATLLYLAEEGLWEELYALLRRHMTGTESWAEPQPDLEEAEQLMGSRKNPHRD